MDYAGFLVQINAYSAALTSVATITGLLFVWRQIAHAKASLEQLEGNRIAELQPYVSVALIEKKVRNQACVVIQITNHGRTPARNLRLKFEPAQVWHFVSKPTFPFATEDGISVLAPAEVRNYFLGRLVPGTAFFDAMKQAVPVELIFKSEIKPDETIQNVALALNDGTYQITDT